jgi:hypothetical protein
MRKEGSIWVADHNANSDWGGLAKAVHARAHTNQESLAERYPWKDNIWLAFWDIEQRICGMIHCSTSFNGAPRTARAVLAYQGRILSCDETPTIGSLSSPSIDVDGSISPGGTASGPHRVSVSTPDFALDLTLSPRRRPMDWTVLHLVPSLGDAPELDHWQQSFSASGHVRVGTARLQFTGWGFRDRTWGWRQESLQWLELYAVDVVLEKCDISMCKWLCADGSTSAGGFVQDDQGLHQVISSELTYNKVGLAQQVTIHAGKLAPLTLDAGVADAGWWLTFTKPNSKAPVWTEYENFCSFDGGAWGRGYGCIPHAILRKLS